MSSKRKVKIIIGNGSPMRTTRPDRNAPCECGSGLKQKKCCGCNTEYFSRKRPQAAQEFNDSISYEGSSDRVAFTAGVEFAESWIPVEEEMPEQMTESDYSAEVLTQTKNGYYWLNQYDYESKAWTESPSGDPVINWRPINRKA